MKITIQNTVSGFIHKPKVKSILINHHEQPSADFPKPCHATTNNWKCLPWPWNGTNCPSHWDRLKQVCWAKAAPVPAAFVLAQDSDNSRWQSNTFIKTAVGGGRRCSHSSPLLIIYMLLRNTGWVEGSLSPPPRGSSNQALMLQGLCIPPNYRHNGVGHKDLVISPFKACLCESIQSYHINLWCSFNMNTRILEAEYFDDVIHGSD